MADRSLRFSSWIVGGPRETPRVTSFSAAMASKRLPIPSRSVSPTSKRKVRLHRGSGSRHHGLAAVLPRLRCSYGRQRRDRRSSRQSSRARVREGGRISVHDDRILSRLLRVAPKGAEGDRLLPKAERNFDRDEGIAREWYGEAGMDAFFRANQAVGGTVDRIAGASMGGPLSLLSRWLATLAQPERPAPPGAGLPRLVGRPRRLVIGPAAQRSLAKHFRPPKV